MATFRLGAANALTRSVTDPLLVNDFLVTFQPGPEDPGGKTEVDYALDPRGNRHFTPSDGLWLFDATPVRVVAQEPARNVSRLAAAPSMVSDTMPGHELPEAEGDYASSAGGYAAPGNYASAELDVSDPSALRLTAFPSDDALGYDWRWARVTSSGFETVLGGEEELGLGSPEFRAIWRILAAILGVPELDEPFRAMTARIKRGSGEWLLMDMPPADAYGPWTPVAIQYQNTSAMSSVSAGGAIGGGGGGASGGSTSGGAVASTTKVLAGLPTKINNGGTTTGGTTGGTTTGGGTSGGGTTTGGTTTGGGDTTGGTTTGGTTTGGTTTGGGDTTGGGTTTGGGDTTGGTTTGGGTSGGGTTTSDGTTTGGGTTTTGGTTTGGTTTTGGGTYGDGTTTPGTTTGGITEVPSGGDMTVLVAAGGPSYFEYTYQVAPRGVTQESEWSGQPRSVDVQQFDPASFAGTFYKVEFTFTGYFDPASSGISVQNFTYGSAAAYTVTMSATVYANWDGSPSPDMSTMPGHSSSGSLEAYDGVPGGLDSATWTVNNSATAQMTGSAADRTFFTGTGTVPVYFSTAVLSYLFSPLGGKNISDQKVAFVGADFTVRYWVPEPMSLLLLGGGAALLVARRPRRNQKRIVNSEQ